MKYSIFALILLFAVSCEEPAETKALRLKKNALAWNKPEHIGQLPNGQELFTINYEVWDNGGHVDTHVIYFAGNATTVNYKVPDGKTYRNQVVTFINGIAVETNEVTTLKGQNPPEVEKSMIDAIKENPFGR